MSEEIRCPKCGYIITSIDEGWTMQDGSIRINCQHCDAHFGLEATYGLKIYRKGTE